MKEIIFQMYYICRSNVNLNVKAKPESDFANNVNVL